MAWWDHEELKAPADRSDRYKKAFPEEYEDMQTNRRPWQMHVDRSLEEQQKMAGAKRQRDPKERFFIFVTDENDYAVEDYKDEEHPDLVTALERIGEIEDEMIGEGNKPTFILIRGVEIKIKKAGYTVDTDPDDED